MQALGIARRVDPHPAYQLRRRPLEYLAELSAAARSPGLIARELGRPKAEIAGYWDDLLIRRGFYPRIHQREAELRRSGRVQESPGGRADAAGEVLYVLVRAMRPGVVVETGVALGYSTAFILQALHDNAAGRLHSVDLPTTDPQGRTNADGVRDRVHLGSADDTGAVIPEDLLERWELTLGPSNPALVGTLDRVGPIDLFFHDSDHSYANMIWEYRTAWPRIRPGGWLLSDDVQWNGAFDEFVRATGARSFRWFGPRGHRGAIAKPSVSGAKPVDGERRPVGPG